MTVTATLILTIAINGLVTGTTRIQTASLQACHEHGQRMTTAPNSPWIGYECRERKPRTSTTKETKQ